MKAAKDGTEKTAGVSGQRPPAGYPFDEQNYSLRKLNTYRAGWSRGCAGKKKEVNVKKNGSEPSRYTPFRWRRRIAQIAERVHTTW